VRIGGQTESRTTFARKRDVDAWANWMERDGDATPAIIPSFNPVDR
jgi:hypothetical protein